MLMLWEGEEEEEKSVLMLWEGEEEEEKAVLSYGRRRQKRHQVSVLAATA